MDFSNNNFTILLYTIHSIPIFFVRIMPPDYERNYV